MISFQCFSPAQHPLLQELSPCRLEQSIFENLTLDETELFGWIQKVNKETTT